MDNLYVRTLSMLSESENKKDSREWEREKREYLEGKPSNTKVFDDR